MINVAVLNAGCRRTRTLCAALADAGINVLLVEDLGSIDVQALKHLAPDACIFAAGRLEREQLPLIADLQSGAPSLMLAILPAEDHVIQAGLLDLGINAYVIESISPALLRTIIEACVRRYAREQGLTAALKDSQVALERRRVVDRARCLLMERHGLSEKVAYRQLQSAAMQRGIPLLELARQVLQDATH